MLAKGRGGKIRAPRRGLTKDDVDFDATWEVLSTAIKQIHNKNASGLSFEELFRNAYKLVLKKKQEMLYEKVCELESEWLRGNVQPRIASLITPVVLQDTPSSNTDSQANERRIAGEKFLRSLRDSYQDHQLCMGMIADVLMYMDRLFSQDGKKPPIYTSAMALFRTHVLLEPLAQEKSRDILTLLENVILDMIQMERRGEVIDRAIIRACCAMLEGLYESYPEDESMKLYLTSFEPKFLTASQQFYKEEGEKLLAYADASTFCILARRRLKEEDERCQQTISSITEAKIKAVVDKELISAKIRDVINLENTGVRSMLDNDKTMDLANIYGLIARVDPRKVALKEAVQRRVVELGTEINKAASVTADAPPTSATKSEGDKNTGEKAVNQQTQAAITWVTQVLQLKTKYDRVWEVSFQKDSVMEKALEISFQDFINDNHRSAEHLSLFLDEHLKRGVKSTTEAETDALLDSGILLLQYLKDKDHFETYYKKHMAKRLIMKKSISRDMERQMLSKMKMKIGNQFTQKLEGLIRDTENSETLNNQYRDHVTKLGDPDPRRIDIEASILTTTVWPFETLFRADAGNIQRECKYPTAVERAKQKFEKFYLDKHTGRKLSWMSGLGSADIRATFTNAGGKIRRYELNVSTYAMVILMQFNDLEPGQSLTFEEIEAETNIPKHELIRNLQSLSLVQKWRVLKKDPMSKEIKPTDRFSINESFSSQFTKIKVAVVSSSSNRVENNEERKETQRRADEERGHAVEAAIVRIMKQRKTLAHAQLVSETLQQLSARFQPDVNMVKKKIEALIDREYLERGSDPTKPSYNYLA